MKVLELIQLLEKYPQNAQIFKFVHDGTEAEQPVIMEAADWSLETPEDEDGNPVDVELIICSFEIGIEE